MAGLDYNIPKTANFCGAHVCGKQHQTPFPKTRRELSDKLLKILHGDICRKIETVSLAGTEYFITFIDDRSQFVWVCMMELKSKVFQKFLK